MKENMEPVKILNETESKELIKKLNTLNLFDWKKITNQKKILY